MRAFERRITNMELVIFLVFRALRSAWR